MTAQPFIAPSHPLDRRHLGKYEVLARISTGGMSEIFLATQSGLAGFKKLVVLKTILPNIGGEEDFVRMFLDEARITAAFNHPNIAQVFELDVAEATLFMAMEFVQGCTLVELARACRLAKESIPIGLTLQAVRDTALALHYAHTFTDPRGRKQVVIHRDVAEKNIMVTYEGVTKLLDFGIAKASGRAGRTNFGMVKGTSGYMSPEQIRGEELDGRSDIFALGVVLHECLTGMRLFHGKNLEDGMMAALRETAAPPSKQNPNVTPEIDAITIKALSRKREDRYATALEMARAIEKAAPGAIWHPEQTGEVVQRLFADRRQETIRLLEANYGKDNTGEIKIDSLLAKVKAAQALSAPQQLDKGSGPPTKPLPGPVPNTPNPPGLKRTATPPPTRPVEDPAPPPAPMQAPAVARTARPKEGTPPVPQKATVPAEPPKVPPPPMVPPVKPLTEPIPRGPVISKTPLPQTAPKGAEVPLRASPGASKNPFEFADEAKTSPMPVDPTAKRKPLAQANASMPPVAPVVPPIAPVAPPQVQAQPATSSSQNVPTEPKAPSISIEQERVVPTAPSANAPTKPDVPAATAKPAWSDADDASLSAESKTTVGTPFDEEEKTINVYAADLKHLHDQEVKQTKRPILPIVLVIAVVLVGVLLAVLYAFELPPFQPQRRGTTPVQAIPLNAPTAPLDAPSAPESPAPTPTPEPSAPTPTRTE